jgi:hypothetical protein
LFEPDPVPHAHCRNWHINPTAKSERFAATAKFSECIAAGAALPHAASGVLFPMRVFMQCSIGTVAGKKMKRLRPGFVNYLHPLFRTLAG